MGLNGQLAGNFKAAVIDVLEADTSNDVKEEILGSVDSIAKEWAEGLKTAAESEKEEAAAKQEADDNLAAEQAKAQEEQATADAAVEAEKEPAEEPAEDPTEEPAE